MRISIFALGSRGDVQPYLALALGLSAAGHRVHAVTLGGYGQLAAQHGVQHTEILPDPPRLTQTLAGRQWLRRREGPVRFMRGLLKTANAVATEALAHSWEVSRDAEAVIASPIGLLVAQHIAEKLRAPLVMAHYVPPRLTTYHWNGRRSARSIAQWLWNTPTQAGLRLLGWQALRSSANLARAQVLGLPPLSPVAPVGVERRIGLHLCGFSQAVVRRPPDWPAGLHVTGYWFLDRPADWQPDPGLTRFLSAGPAPVYVGFGSPLDVDAAQTAALAVEALGRAGQRGIIQGERPPGLEAADVYFVRDVPHDWLLPRVTAAVHHGGAGTTAATLRFGLPSVLVPGFADQPFWAARVYELGAALRPLPKRELSVDRLGAAIAQVVTDGRTRERAQAIGRQIRAERGVACAVGIFEQFLWARRDRVPSARACLS